MSEFVEYHELGMVRGPEFQIRLASLRRRRNPDVLFIFKARFSKLLPNHLEGPPDLIVEIVSPDSEARDWRDKYNDYESAGVREYWVIDPSSKRLEGYSLSRSKKFARLPEDPQGRIFSKVFRSFYIRPAWLWRSPLPKLAPILKELGLRG